MHQESGNCLTNKYVCLSRRNSIEVEPPNVGGLGSKPRRLNEFKQQTLASMEPSAISNYLMAHPTNTFIVNPLR
jgi:hypothetical protein